MNEVATAMHSHNNNCALVGTTRGKNAMFLPIVLHTNPHTTACIIQHNTIKSTIESNCIDHNYFTIHCGTIQYLMYIACHSMDISKEECSARGGTCISICIIIYIIIVSSGFH